MTTAPEAKPKHRRNKRHNRSPAPVASPAQVIAQVRQAPAVAVSVEQPLTPKEVALYKVHFRFLREHRNVLKLRVNAAEDLLLNGVREPVHRGVCQHLLAKVERSRVLAVSQTLPTAEAVRLLGGVLRFAPEMGYVLRYLECVKQTASAQQAGAALTQALKQTDYSQLSVAQMRQLVALIVEVFAERDLPVFLFTMLHDDVFRAALDRSLDDFPEILRRMLRPLRSVYAVVRRDGSSPRNAGVRSESNVEWLDVQKGVGLMLDVHPASLLELHDRERLRLFQLGCQNLRAHAETRQDTLQQLLDSLSFGGPGERLSALLDFTAALLSSGQYAAAKRILDTEHQSNGQAAVAARWREALEAPRVGTVALERTRPSKELPPSGRWYRGWDLRTQSDVLLRFGEPAESQSFAQQLALLERLLVPGLCRVVAREAADGRRPYLAVELPGQPLHREAKQSSRLDSRVRLRWAVEVCSLLAALAHQQVVLADAELRRFNAAPDGGLWLVDCWPLRQAQTAEALRVHTELAKRCCRQLLAAVPSAILSDETLEQVERAEDLWALVATLEGRSSDVCALNNPESATNTEP